MPSEPAHNGFSHGLYSFWSTVFTRVLFSCRQLKNAVTLIRVARFAGASDSIMTTQSKLGQHTQEVFLSLNAGGN